MSQRLRTAILGCGGFAHRHARTLQFLKDDFEMVAFCNRTIEKAATFSKQYTDGQAPVFADHHQMFDQVPLDVVVICLPPYAHSDEVEIAANLGVHVFIEKPIALTSEQGWRMVNAAENAGIITQVGFMFRFGEAIEHLKTKIDSGDAGPVGLMSARYFCNSLHSPWWRKRDLSGGQLVEQVIHMVDLMRFLMGDAITAYSRQENIFHQDVEDYTVEDVSATIFSFPKGGVGVIYATNGEVAGRGRRVVHGVPGDRRTAGRPADQVRRLVDAQRSDQREGVVGPVGQAAGRVQRRRFAVAEPAHVRRDHPVRVASSGIRCS